CRAAPERRRASKPAILRRIPRNSLYQRPVIPGRRASAGPGIQMHIQRLFLDSGFAGNSPRPGMTGIYARHELTPVFFPVRTEQLLLARPVFRNGGDEVGDVEKIHVVEIVGDRISAPGAAAHAEREIEPVVEAAAI